MPSDEAASGTSEDGTRRSLPRGFFAMGTLSDLVVRQRDALPGEAE